MYALLLGLLTLSVRADEIAPGKIIDKVVCQQNPSESYALYLPSNYSQQRAWSVIFAFDPGARGRVPVERFEAAAEKFGYIVAASNNSRNGSWEASISAMQAMSSDVFARFATDEKRIYTAGMSGGARVAFQFALGVAGRVAGVFASSAGYPDSKPRKSVPFAVFGTAGTEDFNYLEMKQLEKPLTTPHRVVIFEGGHVWLSSELAIEGVEWMEIQAMKSGIAKRNDGLINESWERRVAAMEALGDDASKMLQMDSIVADFKGLKDVSALASRAAELRKQKNVKKALQKQNEEETREEQTRTELYGYEQRVSDPAQRADNLIAFRDKMKMWAAKANAEQDSSERRLARRVVRGVVASGAGQNRGPEVRKILDELGLLRRPRA